MLKDIHRLVKELKEGVNAFFFLLFQGLAQVNF
jgi:hypothetical protein